jgi:hypothetical protein
MAGYVQIIEMKTSRIDEIDSLIEELRAARGPMPMARATMTADRDRPDHYLSIIEFDSYEEAMANSNRPETTQMAQRMAALCDEPPKFYNLDVRRSETR